jgi:hypothetical protein
MGQSFVAVAPQTRPAAPESSLLESVRTELDWTRQQIAGFADLDADEVLAVLSAIVGRLAELRAQLQRDGSPRATALRTRELDPLRDDLDLLFKIWSRRIALMEWEARLSGGAP